MSDDTDRGEPHSKRRLNRNVMKPAEFGAYHQAALETDEVRHGLILIFSCRLAKEH